MQVAIAYNSERSVPLFLGPQPSRERLDAASVERLVAAARAAGHEVIACEADHTLMPALHKFFGAGARPQPQGVVLNVAYGMQGRDRQSHVPSLLEMEGIPYVGSPPLVQGILLDKQLTKLLLSHHGLATPCSLTMDEMNRTTDSLPYPLIVKPRYESLSLDVAFVQTPAELRAAWQNLSRRHGDDILVEEYIAGREFNVSVLEGASVTALPPVEIVFNGVHPHIFSTADKLAHHPAGPHSTGPRGVCPADIPASLSGELQRLATRAFRVLQCRDLARVDFRVSSSRGILILEVNGLPSLRPTSSLVLAASRAGLSLDRLIDRLVTTAYGRYRSSFAHS